MTRRPTFALLALASLALVSTACQLPPFLPEFQVNTSDPGYNFSNDVAMGEHGDFIVTWSESSTDVEVFGRGFAASTAPFGAPFPVNANAAPDRQASSIARDASGRFVIVWSENNNAEIWGQRWDFDGTPLGGNFQINTTTGTVSRPHVASDASGNFVVTWTSDVPPNMQAVARRFDHNGAPLGDEFTVSAYTTGDQSPSGIAMSPTGFVVTWFGEGAAGDGVFHRMFDDAGAPSTGDFQTEHRDGRRRLSPSRRRHERRRRFRRRMGRHGRTLLRGHGAPLRFGRSVARRRLSDQRHEPRGLRPEGHLPFRRKLRRDVEQRARAPRRGGDQ